MAGQQATGVKVVKETYHPDTGDYLSLKIFEDGHNKLKTKPQAEDLPHALPCFKPDDLYSYHARSTMARLLCDYLSRNKLTVTELIHRADALEKFEATGTLFQHAIQKVAVAQASATSVSVQQIVKSLNELATKAIHRVYRDERRGAFARSIRRVRDSGNKARRCRRCGLSAERRHREKPTHRQKLGRESSTAARDARRSQEWRRGSAAAVRLCRQHRGRGPARLGSIASADRRTRESRLSADQLGDALPGRAGARQRRSCRLIALTSRFAQDRLPASRTAIANRILAELKSVRRLCPGSLMDEFAMLKRIANKLVLGQGKYLAHEDIVAAFALRSRRLVSHERVQEYLDGTAAPDEKLERLLFIEENIVGAENKRQLAGFVMPIVTAAPFESHFVFGKTPLPARLHRIADLQRRVLKSGFQEHERTEIAGVLDRIAGEMESRAKLLDGIESKSGNAVEGAQALLKLFAAGLLTEGAFLRARGRCSLLILVSLVSRRLRRATGTGRKA